MSETNKYRRNRCLDIGGTKTVGESKCSLIFSNAIWKSSFQIVGWFFLKRQKMCSHMSINLAMKQLIYYNLPRKPLISFSVLSTSMLSMTLILSGLTSMPRSLTICPNNFPEVTPKVHFLRFSLYLNFWILSKNLSRVARWSTLLLDFTIISSISLCIMSWNKVVVAL